MQIYPPMRMRALLPVVMALIFAIAFGARGDEASAPNPDSKAFPKYVMNKIDDQYRGAKSHGIMEMRVKTKHWTRTMTAESWSLGKEYSLVRILAPKKERGTSTLKAGNDLFTYLSKTSRTIKVTAGMMGGSWMGSHFTNDDLVRHSRLSDDFEITLVSTDDEGNDQAYRFKLVPKPDAPVVWGKIEVTVRVADLQPLSQIFFDEDGKKVRTLTFTEHKRIDDRVMPMKMIMRPNDNSGEFTEVKWKEIDFKVNLNKSFFSVQKLKTM